MLKRGKVPKSRSILGIRPLKREDLEKLKDERASTPRVQRLRDPHHMLARLIAAGVRPLAVAAERSGYSYTRAQILTQDPAFQQLVAEYREVVTEAFVAEVDVLAQTAVSNMKKAERMLAEKLEEADEAGELLPTKDLLAITADRFDRFGYGKKNTTVNVNLDFAAQLERRLKRSSAVIEHQQGSSPPSVGGEQPVRRIDSLPVQPPAAPAAPQLILRRA